MITKESPLRGMNIGSPATVSIRELPGLSGIDLRVAPGSAAQAAIEERLGLVLPGKTGQTHIHAKKDAHIFCLAPDAWLLVGYPDAIDQLAALEAHHFSAVDVSGQRTTIELEGPNARAVLAHLWEQDLREKNFPPGSVSQGLMAKAPVILFHMAEGRYRVMVRSSFAVHLSQVLVDAAAEWL